MRTYIAAGARSASHTDVPPSRPPLPRGDQIALEFGFPARGPALRRRRVEQVSRRVAEGAYDVDAARVAGALVDRLRRTS